MKFQEPLYLYLLLPVALLLIAFAWRSARIRRRHLETVVAPRLREMLTGSVNYRARALKLAMFVFGVAALLVALARPQWGERYKEIERTSVDFMIALDLSNSMRAEDAASGASRLVSAKKNIADFLDSLGADRVGLIAFAGEAYVAAPITQDHEAVKRNLASLDTKSIAKQGTDIAAAITLAAKTFASGDYESKALVIVTDGEELQGDAVIAARSAGAKGMSVFTVGVGTTRGARIPREERSANQVNFEKNEFGHEVVTRLNERVMQQIAVNGHGFYAPLGDAGEGLRTAYERGLRPLGHGVRLKPSKDLIDRFQWPLGVAILLLLVETLLSERSKAKAPRRSGMPPSVPKPILTPAKAA